MNEWNEWIVPINCKNFANLNSTIIIIIIIPYLCVESGPMPNYKGRRITKDKTNNQDQYKVTSEVSKRQ